MTLSVVAVVTFTILFMLGYRLDLDNGRLEQNSLVQFGSSPSGATVAIDGAPISSRTPNKVTLSPGEHEFAMWREGYETWEKTLTTTAGTLTWLNYVILVPKVLTVEPVTAYEALADTLASPDGQNILVQPRVDEPVFSLVDISSDKAESTDLTIPTDIYSDAVTAGVKHTFSMVRWDEGGRYVIVQHSYADTSEWLVLDTQNVSETKNVTRTFDIVISDLRFAGTGGNIFYELGGTDVRKLDLSAGTISRPLINNVKSFDVYDSNIMTYIGLGKEGTNERIAGIYRDGDSGPSMIKSTTSKHDVPFSIATTKYFNQNYIAISEGTQVTILTGNYPDGPTDETGMRSFASFVAEQPVRQLEFSPTGEYVFIQADDYFATYDLEYQKLATSTLEGAGTVPSLKWLDDNYLWSDRGGSLTIREFDGANKHTINAVQAGQDVVLTHNGRFLYSFSKTDDGFQLQRVRMILP